MSEYNDYIDDESNIDDMEEGSDVPSVKRIMISNDTRNDNSRFGNAYNPARRKLLTENDRPFPNNAKTPLPNSGVYRNQAEGKDRALLEVNSYKLKYVCLNYTVLIILFSND